MERNERHAKGTGYYRDILTGNKDWSLLKIRTWIGSSRFAKAFPIARYDIARNDTARLNYYIETPVSTNRSNFESKIILLFPRPVNSFGLFVSSLVATNFLVAVSSHLDEEKKKKRRKEKQKKKRNQARHLEEIGKGEYERRNGVCRNKTRVKKGKRVAACRIPSKV